MVGLIAWILAVFVTMNVMGGDQAIDWVTLIILIIPRQFTPLLR